MYSLASSTSAAFLEDARPFAYLLMNIGVETWMSRTSFQSDSPCRHNSQTYQYKFTSLLLTRVTSVSKARETRSYGVSLHVARESWSLVSLDDACVTSAKAGGRFYSTPLLRNRPAFHFLTNLAWILQLEKPSGYGVAPLNSNVLCCTIMPAYLVASFASLRAGSNASVCLRIGISLSLLVGICWMVFAHVIPGQLPRQHGETDGPCEKGPSVGTQTCQKWTETSMVVSAQSSLFVTR